MNGSKKVAVVIPFYKSTISNLEKISLTQAAKTLAGYPLIGIKPLSLIPGEDLKTFPFTDIISFDDSYFEGIEGYNALMLSDIFYKAFLDYEFILIHQLDAFIFKDELGYWCKQPFDYIGAPWTRVKDYPDFFKALKSKIQFYTHARFDVRHNGIPSHLQYEYRVGNGGLSLRRVKKFYELSIKLRYKMDEYLTRTEHQFHEDIFWSIEVNRKHKILKIPGFKKALKFSMEQAPVRSLKTNNNQLPFGCHAWDKQLDFWRPVFKTLGYDI